MGVHLRYWLKISVFNLMIVAFLGVILRYKIAYALPIVDQKHLLHGHSHFAFTGWITQALMVLLINYLSPNETAFKKYKILLYTNLIAAYGMLLSFPVQGYGLISISFSTLSTFVSYAFAVMYWKDLNKMKEQSVAHFWFKAAISFNAVSSLGAFVLAFLIANKVPDQNWYLASIYFFLHFQYNGWFFFACMGLLVGYIFQPNFESKKLKIIFWLFFAACIPAYFLSTLWLAIPLWAYVLIVIAAFAQLIAWFLFIRFIKNYFTLLKNKISLKNNYLLYLSAIALTVKLLLQMGSTVPSLSQLAFGFHPIVIGYLHLVLLGIITLFILGYIFANSYFSVNRITLAGTIIFTSGIIINEVLLMMQGTAAILYKSFSNINDLLFCTAIILFTGMLLINAGQRKSA